MGRPVGSQARELKPAVSQRLPATMMARTTTRGGLHMGDVEYNHTAKAQQPTDTASTNAEAIWTRQTGRLQDCHTVYRTGHPLIHDMLEQCRQSQIREHITEDGACLDCRLQAATAAKRCTNTTESPTL